MPVRNINTHHSNSTFKHLLLEEVIQHEKDWIIVY